MGGGPKGAGKGGGVASWCAWTRPRSQLNKRLFNKRKVKVYILDGVLSLVPFRASGQINNVFDICSP